MYQDPEEDLELQELFNECSEWWEKRETRGIHRSDSYLRGANQAPRITQPALLAVGARKNRDIASPKSVVE